MSDEKLEGGCACGTIRYACNAAPKFSFLCQCRDCQQATGTGHSAAFMMDRNATSVAGDMAWYERTAPSGNTISQGFCGKCGSPMMNKNSGHADVYFINAGSLDDPNQFKPQKVVYRESATDWDLLDPEG